MPDDRGQKLKDDILGERNTSQGDIKIEKYLRYYDVNHTITVAGATDPNNQDANVYNEERVHDSLQRNAPAIMVINDQPTGGNTLFMIVSHGGGQTFSPETPLYPQETKTYYNIYEVRLRSALQGHTYRVTEYNVMKR